VNLKCAPCTDEAVIKGDRTAYADIPDAWTLAPVVQTFNMGGQQIAAPLALPVCVACREKQLGKVSKNGLILS
jgi:hypothetical protein